MNIDVTSLLPKDAKTVCMTDPDLFFDHATQNEAKKACSFCPFREECLELAMQAEATAPWHQYRYGVYGGLSGRQRKYLQLARGPVQPVCDHDQCGKEYERTGARQRFCSPACKAAAREARRLAS